MLKEFSKSTYNNDTLNYKLHMSQVVKYLKTKIGNDTDDYLLDIGEKSKLTDNIKSVYKKLIIDNTNGDLDIIMFNERKKYDYVLYSHTIEHQFNPLHTLLEIKKVMHDNSRLFVILPRRGKLLWDKGHYHEIDHYRMKLLIKRADYKLRSYELKKSWRPLLFYLTGIRPIMRLFCEYNAYYELTLNK